MKQSVILKSNANGITLILNDQVPFNELIEDIIEVFLENEEFFGKSRFAIAFKGRTLTEDEEVQIVMAINERTSANILRLISEDSALDEQFKQQKKQFDQLIASNTGRFHKGNLLDKDLLETEQSIVILGDVHKGARIISKGNVIVLGSLKGSVHAGAGGNEESFVAALVMEPTKLRISDLTYYQEEKKSPLFFKGGKHKDPQIAMVVRGKIEMNPIISD